MQRLEVNGAVRHTYMSLGVKGLKLEYSVRVLPCFTPQTTRFVRVLVQDVQPVMLDYVYTVNRSFEPSCILQRTVCLNYKHQKLCDMTERMTLCKDMPLLSGINQYHTVSNTSVEVIDTMSGKSVYRAAPVSEKQAARHDVVKGEDKRLKCPVSGNEADISCEYMKKVTIHYLRTVSKQFIKHAVSSQHFKVPQESVVINTITKEIWAAFTCITGEHAVAYLGEALRYKPPGRGFDSPWGNWDFSLKYSFRPHYGVDSASNRNG
jgi:hypothetical protein